jgi:20S proteasome alpha/beta subunit
MAEHCSRAQSTNRGIGSVYGRTVSLSPFRAHDCLLDAGNGGRRMIGPIPKPWSHLEIQIPADWGCGVTICIAATCNWDGKSEAIVTASDHMVSMGHFSADNVCAKIEPIHPQWEVMFAADDMTDAEPIINGVRLKISKILGPRMGLKQVMSAFSGVYKQYLKDETERQFLSPFGITVREFMSKRFGPERFPDILNKIKAAHIECEFLVCGFGAQGEPHIFTMSGIGKVNVYDRLGFWAIGSGQQSALSSLFFHRYNRNLGPLPAVYHVCEAKFMSETAVGVGKVPTFVSLHYQGNKRAYVLEHSVDSIRGFWKKEGCPRVPRGVLEHIGKECIEGYDPESKQRAILKF